MKGDARINSVIVKKNKFDLISSSFLDMLVTNHIRRLA